MVKIKKVSKSISFIWKNEKVELYLFYKSETNVQLLFRLCKNGLLILNLLQ